MRVSKGRQAGGWYVNALPMIYVKRFTRAKTHSRIHTHIHTHTATPFSEAQQVCA